MRSHPFLVVSLLFAASCEEGWEKISYGVTDADLFGRVTIEGRPAAGITVVASEGSGTFTTQTDANGRYEFRQLRFGTVTVSLRSLPESLTVDQPRRVELGNGRVEVNFSAFGPAVATGRVLWEFAIERYMGVPGISARMEQPPFPVADVTSAADGVYRFQRAPGYGQFPVVLGALSGGLTFIAGRDFSSTHRWTYNARAAGASAANGVILDTAIVTYYPSADLDVEVFVDGDRYQAAIVHLNTPIPITHRPDYFVNLPVMSVEVRLSGVPDDVEFDARVKTVQLASNATASVTFTGYSPGANRPPVPTILAPANGATFAAGTPITFRGSASDLEDGALTGNALGWQILGSPLGRGGVIAVDTLPIGQHRVVLRVTDSRGSEASSFVDINVVAATLTTTGRISGTVTVDGAPANTSVAAGARVDLSTTPMRSTIADAQGRYAFENVPAGTYWVTLQPVMCAEFDESVRSAAVVLGATTVVNFAGVYVEEEEDGSNASRTKRARKTVRGRPPF